MLAIFDTYDSFYGLGLFILGLITAYKYGFFKKRPKTKIVGFILLLLITIESSSFLKDNKFGGLSLNVILFVIFFIVIIYIIYKEEIDRILFLDKEHKKSMAMMVIERNESLYKIKDLNEKVLHLEEEISSQTSSVLTFEQFNISKKEKEIIKILCKEGLSNKEMAAKLFISVGTVKQHLNNIFRKCEINRRSELIFLFQDIC
jgi:DNA-binding CsgD family transcriptional regulator